MSGDRAFRIRDSDVLLRMTFRISYSGCLETPIATQGWQHRALQRRIERSAWSAILCYERSRTVRLRLLITGTDWTLSPNSISKATPARSRFSSTHECRPDLYIRQASSLNRGTYIQRGIFLWTCELFTELWIRSHGTYASTGSLGGGKSP